MSCLKATYGWWLSHVCLVTQLCPILCNPPGSFVHGDLQARILEWVAMPSSRGSSQPRNWTQDSCIVGGFFTSWATILDSIVLEGMSYTRHLRDSKIVNRFNYYYCCVCFCCYRDLIKTNPIVRPPCRLLTSWVKGFEFSLMTMRKHGRCWVETLT